VADLGSLTIGGRTAAAEIHRALDLDQPCEVLLVRSDEWYDRDGIYRDRRYVEFPDAGVRAAFFGACVDRWLAGQGDRFGLMHGNDWQSGMALFLIRGRTRGFRPRLLFNIHNAQYQGQLPPGELFELGLPRERREQAQRAAAGRPSLMLLALLAADRLVTCSPTYARELPSMLAGTPLSAPLARLALAGIVSGVDPAVWSPDRPGAIARAYDAETVTEGKRANRSLLQEVCGLRADPEVTVYGVCGRLVPEKGIDLVLAAIAPHLRSGRAQLVVMGPGEARYHQEIRCLAQDTPGRVRGFPRFEPDVARLLYAGCDFVLMPSRVEPCGLNQLIALRFGTLPIVAPVGGLNDTVLDLRHRSSGVGLVLAAPASWALAQGLEFAHAWLHGSPPEVAAARRRAMAQDWTWRRTAGEFRDLYQRLIDPAEGWRASGGAG
jgi:starch synthase